MLNRLLLIGWLLAAAALSPGVHAQKTLYKSTMPDGSVVFGDKPVPGAAKVESSKPDTSSKGFVPPTSGERETLQKLEQGRRQREGQADRVPAAERALAAAQAARDAGKEPKEGERTGTAGGGSRLNDAYWERQKALDNGVEQARRDLENAKAGK